MRQFYAILDILCKVYASSLESVLVVKPSNWYSYKYLFLLYEPITVTSRYCLSVISKFPYKLTFGIKLDCLFREKDSEGAAPYFVVNSPVVVEPGFSFEQVLFSPTTYISAFS